MKVNFDEFAKSYDELLSRETGFFTADEAYFAQYKVHLTRAIINREPASILEFGCGTGRNLRFLQQYFSSSKICASDVSAKSLEVARAENPGVDVWLEGDRQSERTGFDLIFVAGVFHHVPGPERAEVARTVSSRLSSGGSVVVFEHNPYNPVTRRIVSNCEYDQDAVLLAPKELREVLETAGLKVAKHAYSLFFPPAMRFLCRLESKLGWLPLGGQYWVHAIKA